MDVRNYIFLVKCSLSENFMQHNFPWERNWVLGGLFSCSGINNLSFLGEWSEEPRYPHQGIISNLSCWFDWWGCWVIISSIFPKFNSHRLGSVKREVNFMLSGTDTQLLSVFNNISYLHFQRVIWRHCWEHKRLYRDFFVGVLLNLWQLVDFRKNDRTSSA